MTVGRCSFLFSFRRGVAVILLAFVMLGQSAAVRADHLPKWEAGLGLGFVQVPPYRGISATKSYSIPFPYLRYRGESVRIDDDGIRAGLLKSESVKLDFSIAGNVPVRREKNGLRSGMAGLDSVAEIGPTIDWRIARDVESASSIWFHVPWRPVFSVGSPWLAYRGWVLAPYLEFNRTIRGDSRWQFSVATGPMFGSERYHDYFYEVNAGDVTPQRPEYHPGAGYSGSRVTLSLVRNSPRLWAAAFARYDDLRGATFADSPLVQTQHYFVFGVTAAWVFVHSDARNTH